MGQVKFLRSSAFPTPLHLQKLSLLTFFKDRVDQFWYIKIQPKTIDVSTRL